MSRDAFAGGFVAGLVEGRPLEECVDMGHWLASLSIKELGPQYVIPFPLHLSHVLPDDTRTRTVPLTNILDPARNFPSNTFTTHFNNLEHSTFHS